MPTAACRLRQCCCHLSLLTSALTHAESDQDDLDLELAMGALSLGDSSRPGAVGEQEHQKEGEEVSGVRSRCGNSVGLVRLPMHDCIMI